MTTAIGTHHCYITEAVSEHECVRYIRRVCRTERATIHFHAYKRDGYKMACEGHGCYSLIPE